MISTFLTLDNNRDHIQIASKGEWTLKTVPLIEEHLKAIKADKPIVWDVSAVSEFDSAGVLLFSKYLKLFSSQVNVKVSGYSKGQEDMYTLLKNESYNFV